jgi:hypothetical protein
MDKAANVKLEVFVPADCIDALREALAGVGAGRSGKYDHCCSIVAVRGYWRPLAEADPYLGEPGEVSSAEEYKREVNCRQDLVKDALQTIRRVHPYEEPVINIIPLANHMYED